jgi:hypothetical protein
MTGGARMTGGGSPLAALIMVGKARLRKKQKKRQKKRATKRPLFLRFTTIFLPFSSIDFSSIDY